MLLKVEEPWTYGLNKVETAIVLKIQKSNFLNQTEKPDGQISVGLEYKVTSAQMVAVNNFRLC